MAQTVQQLEKNITYLESTNAHIMRELLDADLLLRRVGFSNGLETVKQAATEIIRIQRGQESQNDNDWL